MKVIFASSNKNKIREVAAFLPRGYDLFSLDDAGIKEEIAETGESLRDNSLLKAKFVRDHTSSNFNGAVVFADDSGLEVEALEGAPGVYSARYAGVQKDDKANNAKLLEALKLKTNRKARFVTVITLLIGDETHFFEGEVRGTIAHEERGTNGFGYDPLFIPTGFRSTFAELGPDIKNAISHRGKAVKLLAEFLSKREI